MEPRVRPCWRGAAAAVRRTVRHVLTGDGRRRATVVQARDGNVSHTAAVVAPGLLVMSVILFMGAVSGAHLNPAVSLAFSLRGDFPWRRIPGYVLAQTAGATLACLMLRFILGDYAYLGTTEPGRAVSDGQAFAMEVLLTVGLVSTILGTASRAQNVGSLSAVAVGAYVALAGLWASPISGASMNPVRSLGPALVSNHWAYLWSTSPGQAPAPYSPSLSPSRSVGQEGTPVACSPLRATSKSLRQPHPTRAKRTRPRRVPRSRPNSAGGAGSGLA